MKMPRALFLCSGTGSVGEPFREAGWEVTDVDWDGRCGAEIQTDITTWDYKAAYEPGCFIQFGAHQTAACTPGHEQQEDHAILRVTISWYRRAATLLSICGLAAGLWRIPIRDT